MSNPAIVASYPQTERRFFTALSICMALFVFVGFAPTYFLLQATGTPAPRVQYDPLLHIHAALGGGWVIFLVIQSALIAGNNRKLHIRNGTIGVVLATLLVIVGYVLALRGSPPPGWAKPAFLLVQLAGLVVFGGFTAAALFLRRKPDYHKRLMVLGTMTALAPAGARYGRYLLPGIVPPGPIAGMMLTNLFLLALVLYDFHRFGKLNRATLWGGAIFLASEPLRVWLGNTTIWTNIASALLA